MHMLIFANTEFYCDCDSCVDGSIRIYDIRMGTLITDQIFGEFLKPPLICSFRPLCSMASFNAKNR